MSPSATPATRNERRCRQVPRLPRKVPRRPSGTKRATRASPVPQVARLPRKTTVDVTKRHACHVKQTQMSPRATPATQSTATPQRDQARHQSQPSSTSSTPATQNDSGCHQVSRLPRETDADVTKCHACHAKYRDAPAGPSASPEPAQSHK